MPHKEIITARTFLNSLDKAPKVFEPLPLEMWLDLAIQRKTHPLCILFARQCENLLLTNRPDDLGMLTLRQLSKLSDDLVFYEQKETHDDLSPLASKRDDIHAIAESRLGQAAALLFVVLYDELNTQVIPSIKHLLHGKRSLMSSDMVDALFTYNEDLAADTQSAYAELLTDEQRLMAKRNVLWVDAYREYLPRMAIELLARLQTHPMVVQRGEHNDATKLTSYGKQLMERFLQGVFLLPENHRFALVQTMATLGSDMSVMMALRTYTGQDHLLANVPLSLAMTVMDEHAQDDYTSLSAQLTAYISGESNSNDVS